MSTLMRVVTLCGSARFENEFKICTTHLTLSGCIAISLGAFPADNEGDKAWYSQSQKELLDLVHLGKVSQADIVLVVDCPIGDVAPGQVDADSEPIGYVGYSTAREILFSALEGKAVVFLSDLLSGSTSIEEAMTEVSRVQILTDIQPIEVDVALQLVEVAMGRETVATEQDNTKLNMMQAAISEIAESAYAEESLSSIIMIADQTLNVLDIEPMSQRDREGYLAIIRSA